MPNDFINSFTDEDSSNPRIVFGQGTGNSIYYSNNSYSYLFTEDGYKSQTGVAEFSSESILLDHLSEFLSPFVSLKSSIDIDSGLLPPGVRYVGKNYVVFERPPTFQNVFYIPARVEEMREEYDEGDEDEENYSYADYDVEGNQITYRLPIPWQLYVATFDTAYLCASVHMFFMNTSLFSTDQTLWAPTIPNFFANGLLCRPMFDSMYEIDRYEKSIKGVIETAYDWVWNNGTNNDLNETLVQLCIQQPEHPIIKAIPEDRKRLFANNYVFNSHYFESDRVCTFLNAWESLTIPDILTHPWPNPSQGTHFSHHPNQPLMPDNYQDLLYEWIAENYSSETGDTISTSEIEEIVDNEDYSHTEFVEYLTDCGLVLPRTFDWDTSYSYREILDRIISQIPYNNNKHSFAKDISSVSYSISQAKLS